MKKPITVARQEFAENMVNVINSSELPAFVMLEVIRNCMAELSALADKQYRIEKEQYEKELEEGDSDGKTDS